ncbi:hypothetical protein LAZ40_11635 [Cereibacter sphaeroides]|uniref:hypothetical protein n=1 Tax=Cereibacter sphaeroides TaxID=1063 RepID=UPI001F2BD2C5|nr:hypothetical protein [Cereibacter sphaeroides]MCE6959670.1 hypothetical protein [Cereibacter sphaeroides]MCE6974469.1 hypothetical protein [Cereibacter sphaeroides]
MQQEGTAPVVFGVAASAWPEPASRPWEQTLAEYIGEACVSSGRPIPDHHVEMARRRLAEIAEGIPRDARKPHPAREDLSYAPGAAGYVIFDRSSGDCLSGDMPLFPVAMAGAEGRGAGAELRWLHDILGPVRRSRSLSLDGFRAARSAHRRHVERALERGDPVPGAVLADYRREGKRLVLVRPWEAEDVNARTEAISVARWAERLEYLTEGYSARFLSPVEVRRLPGWDCGLDLAARLSAATGFSIVMTRNGKDAFAPCWFHVRAVSGLVNALGACQPDRLVRLPCDVPGQKEGSGPGMNTLEWPDVDALRAQFQRSAGETRARNSMGDETPFRQDAPRCLVDWMTGAASYFGLTPVSPDRALDYIRTLTEDVPALM